jgi:S1-C subfamily serine protease
MFRRSLLAIVAILILGAICLTTWRLSAPFRHQASQQKMRSSVVLIEAFDASNKPIATGSGFFVSADGTLVTNFHVIKGANKIVAKVDSGAIYTISGVLADDSKSDIVLLRTQGRGLPFLKLGNSSRAEVGEHVTVIGSPFGLEGTQSEGIISAKRELPGNQKWLQITAPVSPGSSGSPVIDANGEVLGVVTMLLREARH